PALHLTEALTAELRLTAQRLLGDHRVRTGRPCVDLVIHEVVQLQDVDVARGDRLRQRLTGPSVVEPRLAAGVDELPAVPVRQGGVQQAGDLLFLRTVEDRRGDVGVGRRLRGPDGVQRLLPRRVIALDLPARLGDPTEVCLEHLADVHPARYAERVQHDVDRRPVLEERHVLDRQDLGDDALVAVPAGELVAVLDLALLSDIDPYQLVHAGRQLVAVLPRERTDADDRTGLAVRHLEAGVADLASLLTEDGPQQPLLRGQLGLALRRHLADQDGGRHDLGTDADDAA